MISLKQPRFIYRESYRVPVLMSFGEYGCQSDTSHRAKTPWSICAPSALLMRRARNCCVRCMFGVMPH